MAPPTPKLPRIEPSDASPELVAKASTLAGIHCLLHRRSLTLIRIAGQPSVRSREVVWCVAEALHAAFDGRRLTHKELAAVAEGVISPATLSRALDRAVARGLLTRRTDPSDARLMLIEPTTAAIGFLLARAEGGYAALTTFMEDAERRRRASMSDQPRQQAVVPHALRRGG